MTAFLMGAAFAVFFADFDILAALWDRSSPIENEGDDEGDDQGHQDNDGDGQISTG